MHKGMRFKMSVAKIIIIAVGLFAVLLTFKADFVAERILHKSDDPKTVLRVKYAALAIAVAVCIVAFTLN